MITSAPEPVLSSLKPAVPLFSKKLRPKIGLADDPGHSRSFGLNRCQLLAEGIVHAWTKGQQSPQARANAVRQQFAANRLDFDRPHLNASSADFELPTSMGVEL